MRTRAALPAAAILAAVLAACSANDTTAGSRESASTPDVTVTPSVEETPTEEATDEASDQPYKLTDTVIYENDVKVSLEKFSRAVSSDYAAPENTPYVKFTVRVVNGSDKIVDVTGLTVNCSYGGDGKEGEAIFDEGLDGSPSTRLLAGRTVTVPWGCALPKNESHVQIEVAPDFESEAAIFTGAVR